MSTMQRCNTFGTTQRVAGCFAPSVRTRHSFRGRLQVRAEGLEPGTRVKVKQAVTVYHVPKLPDFNLQGVEGTVDKIVTDYKGKQLSANLPYKVLFLVDKDGASVKFFAHLAEDEVERV